jgi:hypothetical protein
MLLTLQASHVPLAYGLDDDSQVLDRGTRNRGIINVAAPTKANNDAGYP